MRKSRTWGKLGLALSFMGIILLAMGVISAQKSLDKPDAFRISIIMVVLGGVLTVIGIFVVVRELKKKHGDKYTVDKSLNYMFTINTGAGAETVHEFSQIENAIKKLDATRQGVVELAITPPMGGIKKVTMFYGTKDTYAHVQVLQDRNDGESCWEMLADKAVAAQRHLKKLFVDRKMMSFEYFKRK